MARIIFWVDEFSPLVGGLEMRIESMATALSSEGHNVSVFTHRGGVGPSFPFEVVTITDFEDMSRRLVYESSRSHIDLLYVARLLTGIEESHARFIASLTDYIGAVEIRVQSTRGAEILASQRIWTILKSVPVSFQVLNDYSRDLLSSVGYQFSTLTYNPFPINPDRPTSEGREGYLFLGRVTKAKRVYELIEAWISLVEIDSTLTLCGSPHEEDLQYYNLCRDLSEADARVYWTTGDQQVAKRMLKRHKFLLLPSEREGHSNSLCEAMSFGCVSIVSNVPGLSEHVDMNRGLVFRDGNIADAILSSTQMLPNSYQAIQYSAWDYSQSNIRDVQLENVRDRLHVSGRT